MVLVCAFALSKGLCILVEQPQHSSLELHPRFVDLWGWTPWFRSAFWGGAYALGAIEQESASPKRHWIWSNDRTLLRRVSIAAGRLSGEQLQQLQNKPLTTRKRDATGKIVWTGEREAMRQSQCFGGSYSLCFDTCCKGVEETALGHCRSYHTRFGVHLAQLKWEMDNADWPVRLPSFVFSSLVSLKTE